MKVWKLLFLLTLLVSISVALLFFYYQKEVERHPAVGGAAPVSFVVNEGEGAAAVARRLAGQKLISSPLVFRLYLALNNLTDALQAGVFQIPPGASIKEIAGILRHGKFDLKLTFIEGWRREEMAKYLKSKFNPSTGSGLTLSEVERVENQKSKVDFGEEFLRETEGLEGYLFPDTYYIPTWFTAKQLVEMMRANFAKKFQSLQDEASGVEDLVTLASIVEREVKFPEDRPLVAGILLKRWKNDWPLEADATLQYALANQRTGNFDFWPKQITAEDLKLDSPYNTRKYRGLPPTPISNPGLAALRAVFFPQESPYWFYLSDKEGRMHYARTIGEHSRNIAQYLNE